MTSLNSPVPSARAIKAPGAERNTLFRVQGDIQTLIGAVLKGER
jgi:hypothetical protein